MRRSAALLRLIALIVPRPARPRWIEEWRARNDQGDQPEHEADHVVVLLGNSRPTA